MNSKKTSDPFKCLELVPSLVRGYFKRQMIALNKVGTEYACECVVHGQICLCSFVL